MYITSIWLLSVITHLVNQFSKDVRAMFGEDVKVLRQLLSNTLPDTVDCLVALRVCWIAGTGDVISIRLGHEGSIPTHVLIQSMH